MRARAWRWSYTEGSDHTLVVVERLGPLSATILLLVDDGVAYGWEGEIFRLDICWVADCIVDSTSLGILWFEALASCMVNPLDCVLALDGALLFPPNMD